MSRVDHVRKIRDRKQRRDMGNQLPAEELGLSLVNLRFLETSLGKQLQRAEMKGTEVWRKLSKSEVKRNEVR